MQDFIKFLQTQKFEHGEKLEPEALIVAQKVLCNMGLDFIPETYSNFLRRYNGIKAGGCYLFGATVDNDLDIIDQNKLISKPADSIILGYNDFDLLGYNFAKKKYQIIDRTDFEVLDEYDETDVGSALSQIFNP